jgi:hypothetical protein
MGLKQEVEERFFHSGVQELYDHWQSQIPGQGSLFQRHGEWQSGEAPDTWAYQITASNPLDSERLLRKVITYSVLYTAAELVSEEKTDETKPFHPVSPATNRACASWVYSDDLDGFDPFTIDELLQVAVFGGIWHPHFMQRETKS